MEKKIVNTRLCLNKETIAKLNPSEMENVKGGVVTWSIFTLYGEGWTEWEPSGLSAEIFDDGSCLISEVDVNG
jgi:D-Tyr-tRNAtyr deacylase